MIVTEMAAVSKDRCKIYIDQEFAFVLYKGELRLYNIAEGMEIDENIYREIMQKVLPKRAKLRAMNLLQKRQYTEKQLSDKLKEGGYPQEIIDDAITYVKSFHYLDDLQYAVDYITYHEATKSQRRITCELMLKGISADIIKKAFVQWQELGGFQDELKMIRELLEKKHYRPDCEIKEKQKFYALLLRKGFSMENVNKVLDGLDSFA